MSGESVPARFFLEDYVSSRRITKDPAEREPITRGYILIKDDSLFTEPVMHTFGNPKNNFFFYGMAKRHFYKWRKWRSYSCTDV